MLLFDIETDGFLDALTRVHCLVIKDTETGHFHRFRNNGSGNDIEVGVRMLQDAASRCVHIAGHNVIKFDIPALTKVFPWFAVPEAYVLDTMVLARAIYPDIKKVDAARVKRRTMPHAYYGKHTLEAWGHRLGVMKGEYAGDPTILDEERRVAEKWARWNQAMDDYCVQDVVVTAELLKTLQTSKSGAKWFAPVEVEAIRLEHQVAQIIARQERHGFLFDKEKAVKLYSTLTARKLELESELRKVFPPFYLAGKERTPPKDRKGTPPYMKLCDFAGKKQVGWCAGAPYLEVKLVEFNPGSRDHVAIALKRRHGWKPTEFTDDGKPKVDETVLSGLKYPEAKLLSDYFMVLKRLGQIAAGKEAWLNHVGADGRIHGGVVTNGAVTGRMTHLKPNMAQVPASRSPYGHECRELFCVPTGKALTGADADALELRCLAHYMARYDGGAYVKVVLEGKKEEGTDIHSVNSRALGMDPKAKVLDGWTGRDLAKTWFYAFIYGAGDEKLGSILLGKKGNTARKRGKESRDAFMRNLPALGKLVAAVKGAAARGHLIGLDGRVIPVRSEHAALNTLLQSAGAIVMKKALVLLDARLRTTLVPGVNYEFVANVHDEWQIEHDETLGETIGKEAVAAIASAGEHFKFRCPLAGGYAVGRSWADTH